MKAKTLLIGAISGLSIISLVSSTYAFQTKQFNNPNISNETRTAIESALDSKNYPAFQKAIEWTELFPNMTEEKFLNIYERTEHRNEMEKNREKVKLAIEEENYETRREVANQQMIEIITDEEKFTKLVEMHKLLEQANQIREELWLPEMRQNWNIQMNQKWNFYERDKINFIKL